MRIFVSSISLFVLVAVAALADQAKTEDREMAGATDSQQQQESRMAAGGMASTLLGWGADVVSGVIIGLTTSLVWATVIWDYNRRRNNKLEREISNSLKPEGFSVHADGAVGFEVENPTNHSVVIRSVAIRGGQAGRFTVELPLNEASSPRGTSANARGWVELPPHTKAAWAIDFDRGPGRFSDYSSMFLPFTAIVITVQYRTVLGRTKIADIQPARFHEEYMLRAFERAAKGERFGRQ